MLDVRMFCTDLDGTLLGSSEAAQRFLRAWEALPRDRQPVLVYNSGRTVADVQSLVRWRILPAPDYVIGSVGTEIFDAKAERFEDDFTEQFQSEWDPAQIETVLKRVSRAERQPAAYGSRHKSSWYLREANDEVVEGLRGHLSNAGLAVTVIYSGRLFLDVIPRSAGKGSSLEWLSLKLGIPLETTLVAGDSGNDAEMFLLPSVRRLVVANAQTELFRRVAHLSAYYACTAMADGVIEGLGYFGVL